MRKEKSEGERKGEKNVEGQGFSLEVFATNNVESYNRILLLQFEEFSSSEI